MDGSAFHAAGDDDDLAGDVAGERVGREDDDLRGDVLGLRDLAQRHRAGDALERAPSSTSPRVIGDSVQPGATAFTRPRGAMRTISFFSESSRPPVIADFAAA